MDSTTADTDIPVLVKQLREARVSDLHDEQAPKGSYEAARKSPLLWRHLEIQSSELPIGTSNNRRQAGK